MDGRAKGLGDLYMELWEHRVMLHAVMGSLFGNTKMLCIEGREICFDVYVHEFWDGWMDGYMGPFDRLPSRRLWMSFVGFGSFCVVGFEDGFSERVPYDITN